jgi:hypothetical protein
VRLKVRDDHEINIVFMAVTQISVRKKFWRYKLRSWCFLFGLEFRVKDLSFKVEDDLRTLCLGNLLENALEKNNLISVLASRFQ